MINGVYNRSDALRSLRLLRRLMAGIVILALIAAAGWPVYVDPPRDQLHPVDAIVVLGGAHDGREQYGLQLAEQGLAPQVVFTDAYPPSDQFMRGICDGEYSFRVSCFRPVPYQTRGEGREIARRAAAEGWTSIIAITFLPHTERARHILEKCWDGEILMAPSPTDIPPGIWAVNYVYQTAGYLRSALEGC
ncbi:YdcF family protein [Millisia brevis]|uniref:YdcF family protein n=1 Tax=Millisia brevis TaxID=264148 RepID=UPI000B13B362|nr:YdcF family protein [Millisia brevis]